MRRFKDSDEAVIAINNAAVSAEMTNLQNALMTEALGLIKKTKRPPTRQEANSYLLNSVGPAAAIAAIEYATNECAKGRDLSKYGLNGSMLNNNQILSNDLDDSSVGCTYDSSMRQFLIARSGTEDFDALVDPKHKIDDECGYPKGITPYMYRYMYNRDDTARRITDLFPDESWAADLEVFETDDEKEETPLEMRYKELCTENQLLQTLHRFDRLSGIGHFGTMLIGIDDGRGLSEPADGVGDYPLRSAKCKPSTKAHELLYLRPFDEYLSYISEVETDSSSPRYGLPKFYNLVFQDVSLDPIVASATTVSNQRVHWSRVIHNAENKQSSLLYGTPRQQPVFNRLLDLRKIKGGSAEMLWKGGFPGISFEIDPRYAADITTDADFNKDEFKEEVRKYSAGLQRYLTLIGISAKSLAPQVADPSKHVLIQMQAIASTSGIPLRILLGSEQSKLASSQDKQSWNTRLKRRNTMTVEPGIARPTMDRFIMMGVVPCPKDRKYYTGWSDLNAPTDEDKSNLALKWTQAISQYVSTGIIHLIEPMTYFTVIVGLRPRDAALIVNQLKAEGLTKLKEVTPDKGAGQNGVAKNNVSKGERSGTATSRPKKRSTADKKADGTAS